MPSSGTRCRRLEVRIFYFFHIYMHNETTKMPPQNTKLKAWSWGMVVFSSQVFFVVIDGARGLLGNYIFLNYFFFELTTSASFGGTFNVSWWLKMSFCHVRGWVIMSSSSWCDVCWVTAVGEAPTDDFSFFPPFLSPAEKNYNIALHGFLMFYLSPCPFDFIFLPNYFNEHFDGF